MAVCRSGGEESEAGAKLGSRGMGGDGAQDSAVDSENEESDPDPYALESGRLNKEHPKKESFLEESGAGEAYRSMCERYCMKLAGQMMTSVDTTWD